MPDPGLLVIFNLFTASLTLLGVLLAVETISEEVVMIMIGSQRAFDLRARKTEVTP